MALHHRPRDLTEPTCSGLRPRRTRARQLTDRVLDQWTRAALLASVPRVSESPVKRAAMPLLPLAVDVRA
jgi:hypothetical protein